jgi:hypothetical protein
VEDSFESENDQAGSMRVSILAVTMMVMTEFFHRFSGCFWADAKVVL